MQVNVKGRVIPATIEDGTGYADLYAVLEAYGIPVKRPLLGTPQVALRRFAEALGQPHAYAAAEDTFYIAAQPLPALPPRPVGENVEPWRPVTAPICGGPGDRRPNLLERIIAQFAVATNPRYRRNRQGHDETYCNIFVWDVTRALGAEIPHWVVGDGEPSKPGYGRELDANGVVTWLRSRGPDFGWRRCSSSEPVKQADEAANQGRPVVAVWLNPTGIGHVAIVRPGAAHASKGLPLAQAGATNFEAGFVADGFGRTRIEAVEYYWHD